MGMKKDLDKARNILVSAMQEKDLNDTKLGVKNGDQCVATALTTYQAKKKKKVIELLDKLWKDLEQFRNWIEFSMNTEDDPKRVAKEYIDDIIRAATVAEKEVKKD